MARKLYEFLAVTKVDGLPPAPMLKCSRFMKIIENIDLYNFAFFVSDGFSNLSGAVDELGSSGARQSMRNDLAHLTESVRHPIEGCAGN